jgi:hypothetical protein
VHKRPDSRHEIKRALADGEGTTPFVAPHARRSPRR